MAVKMERTKLNKKLKELKKKARTFEVGLFNAEQARKGMLLNDGEAGKQVPRPWFTNTMSPKNQELVDLIEDSGQRYIEGDLPEKRFGTHLVAICKDGVNDPSLKPLKDYTELVKAGLIVRPETGRMRQSRDAAVQIGIDSGKMIDSIKYKSRKTKG